MRPVLVVAALFALTVCPSASAGLAAGARSAGDGWIVHVSVEPVDLGPIAVSVGPLRPGRTGVGRPWLQHEIVFENNGDRTVTFADTGTAKLLGPPGHPVLLASDEGCGYYKVKPLRGACLAYLDFPTVRPHRSITRTITLWKGLRGMKPLAAGTYVFRKPLRFRVGDGVPPPGTGRTATLRLVYRVEAG